MRNLIPAQFNLEVITSKMFHKIKTNFNTGSLTRALIKPTQILDFSSLIGACY